MALSFVLETLLSIKPQDLAMLFLIYDCQHFCENIITKSFNIVLKYSYSEPEKNNQIYRILFQSLDLIDPDCLKDIDNQQLHSSHERIKYMIDQKALGKSFARECNQKPKAFLNKCKDLYGNIDEQTPWEVASKILLYSRNLIVEHVTEVIGGKEERNKQIYDLFLDKQDFDDGNLELCLRRIMMSFRLAGVESQVVLRVMEGFSFMYYQKT